ncbi:RHS repeat domain-containing protein [Pirellulaceae bacterium SH501]
MSNYGFTSAGTSYDDEDRLTGFARASGTFTQSWSLTSVGDWNSITTNGTAQNRTHGPTHELLTAGGQNVTTDVKGNITLLPTTLTTSGVAMAVGYDFDNKLKSADVDNNGSNDVTFQYDALGRRVARQGTSGSFVYVQQDQQTIADYGYGDAPSSPTHRYVYASYIDEPVVRKAAGTSGTIHYYHRNQQHSITAVTTSSGSVAERYAYTAYGQPTILDGSGSVLSSSAINNRYMYTGREWDATVGLYHFRARWMSGLAGRFLTRDPIAYSGSLSLYPLLVMLRYGDPSGNDIYCFTFECNDAAVDSVDIEDVTNVNEKKSDTSCGGQKSRSWKFRAKRQKRIDGPTPCAGYIVQKVTVSCTKSKCKESGGCVENKLSDTFSYFEAWYVGKSDTSPAEGSYTDRGLTPPKFVVNNSCGSYKQIGEVRFFCESVTGNLGKPRVGGGLWPVDSNRTFGNGLCDVGAGVLPATGTEPGWWSAPVPNGDFIDRSRKTSTRSMTVDWDCCCKPIKDRGGKIESEPR